jgi:hypothetical protein
MRREVLQWQNGAQVAGGALSLAVPYLSSSPVRPLPLAGGVAVAEGL